MTEYFPAKEKARQPAARFFSHRASPDASTFFRIFPSKHRKRHGPRFRSCPRACRSCTRLRVPRQFRNPPLNHLRNLLRRGAVRLPLHRIRNPAQVNHHLIRQQCPLQRHTILSLQAHQQSCNEQQSSARHHHLPTGKRKLRVPGSNSHPYLQCFLPGWILPTPTLVLFPYATQLMILRVPHPIARLRRDRVGSYEPIPQAFFSFFVFKTGCTAQTPSANCDGSRSRNTSRHPPPAAIRPAQGALPIRHPDRPLHSHCSRADSQSGSTRN